jgi:hypothetical protein
MPLKFLICTSTGSAGGGTVITGFSTASLALASAALTGGLQLAAATGTLPQRLTTKTELFLDSIGTARSGIVYSADGSHIIIGNRTSNHIEYIRLSDNNITLLTGSTTDPARLIVDPESMTTGFDNRSWFASAGNHLVGFVDTTSSPPRVELFSGSISNPHHVVEHTGGKILVRTGPTATGNYTEFSFAGTGSTNSLAYTGRVTAVMYDALPDFSGSVLFLPSAGSSVIKAAAGTLSASDTLTSILTLYSSFPGAGNTWRDGFFDRSTKTLYVQSSLEDGWFGVDVETMTVVGRAFGPSEFGNPPGKYSTTWSRCPAAVSPDGTRLAMITYTTSTLGLPTSIREITLGIQRARWTWAPGSNVTVKSISLPGMTANQKGSVENSPAYTWVNSEYDHRRTRFFYSLNGGTDRTEFTQNSILDLAVSSAQTLTIDVEMRWTPANHNGPAPFIQSGGYILYS